jgi:hypothetical protein
LHLSLRLTIVRTVTLQYAGRIVDHQERIAAEVGGPEVASCAWWRACCCPGRKIRKNERDLVVIEALREHEARKQQGYKKNAPMEVQPQPVEMQFQPLPTVLEGQKASHVTSQAGSVCSGEELRSPGLRSSPLYSGSESRQGSDSDPDPTKTTSPEAAHVRESSGGHHTKVPQGLHALHLDPILPVAPEMHPKFDVSQTLLKAPRPLSPKLHHLDDDMPGAYPSPLPYTPKAHDLAADEAVGAASAPVEHKHRLSDDAAARPGSPGPGMQNHRLSDDFQLPAAPPPVAVRWPSWSTASGAVAGKGEETTPHELGAVGDELAPIGEEGIEMHRLGADMLASTRM